MAAARIQAPLGVPTMRHQQDLAAKQLLQCGLGPRMRNAAQAVLSDTAFSPWLQPHSQNQSQGQSPPGPPSQGHQHMAKHLCLQRGHLEEGILPPSKAAGAAAWPIADRVGLKTQLVAGLVLLTGEPGQEDTSEGSPVLSHGCHRGMCTSGDKKGSSAVSRALLTPLSLGNSHHGKDLNSEGGSCPHQLPTHVAFSPGAIWAGGTPPFPRAHSMSGISGTSFAQVDFCAGSRTSSSPAAHPSLDEAPDECPKAPGSSLHQQRYETEARSHFLVPKIMFISPLFSPYKLS